MRWQITTALPVTALLVLTLLGPLGGGQWTIGTEEAMLTGPEYANDGNGGLFLENRGQWDNGLTYIAKTGFGHVGLGSDGIYYHLLDRTLNEETGPASKTVKDVLLDGKDGVPVDAAVIKLGFQGAFDVRPYGTYMVSDNTNFILGNDPSRWVAGIGAYKQVEYSNLWDGIGLVMTMGAVGLKYDMVLEPWADPNDISFKVYGHNGLEIQEDALIIHTPIGTDITDTGLIAWYGDGARESVDVRFDIKDHDTYGFELMNYDRSRPVIIDPLVFSTYYGGTLFDSAQDMEMDDAGNLYVVGYTDSYDFPVTKSAYQTSFMGIEDIVVFKMKGDGKSIVYSTYIGGTDDDVGTSIQVDSNGNAFITGGSMSTDFPTTEGVYSEKHSPTEDDYDVIVLKLDSSGSSLLFSTYVPGSELDAGLDIGIDDKGASYVVGISMSEDFPTTSGAYDESLNGYFDIILFMLSSTGSDLTYSTYIGGDDFDFGQALFFESVNAIYVTGSTYSYDFPVTANVRHNGASDVVALKFDMSLSSIRPLIYSTLIGGDDDEGGNGITVDENANAYISGYTYGGSRTRFPTTTGAYDTSFNGNVDVFALKLDNKGSNILYSTFVGGTDDDYGYDICLDANLNAYVCGYTYSNDFPTTKGADYTTFQGGYQDAFVLKLDGTGSSLLYSTYLGGNYDETAYAILLDENGKVAVAGETGSKNFPTTSGVVQTALAGDFDCFVAKLDMISQPSEPRSPFALGGVGYVLLNWTEPITDGGSPILHYTIYKGLTDSSLNVYKTTSDLMYNDTSVTAGTSYYYAVSANNSVGEGPLSTIVNGMPKGRPSPPRDLVLIAGERYVDLDWEAPLLNGGSPLTGYWVYRGTEVASLSQLSEVSPANTYFRDDTAAMGTKYFYAVTAFNIVGESLRTDVLNVSMPDVPSVPLELKADWGDSYVHLSWEVPASSGGLLLNGFKVHRYNVTAPVTLMTTLSSSVMTYNDTAVTNGVEYTYNVTAFNSLGESLPAVVSSTPLGTPGKPSVLPPTMGDGFVHIYWQAPETDGGSPVLGYRVFQLDDQSQLQPVGEVGVTVLDFNMTGLINGRIYYCYVTAFNVLGLGKKSEMISAVPLGPPEPPVDLDAVPGDGYVQLSWTKPSDDGGSPIMRYYVLRGTGQASWETFVELVNLSSLSYNDTKVFNGVTYRYVVRSMNMVGLSMPSIEVSAKPLGRPSSPRNFTLTSGSKFVNVSWLAPEKDGGSPILGYRLMKGDVPASFDVAIDLSPADTTYRDLNVSNGKVYYYTLIAFNIKGDSEPTQVASTKPLGVPSAPRNVRAEVSGEYIKVLWEPPEDNGGAPITGYDIYRSDDDGPFIKVGSVGPGINTYLDKDVKPGGKYSYTVKATNSIGESGASASVLMELEKEGGGGSGLGWLIWLVAAIILMALITGLVLFLVLRKKSPPAPVEPPAQDPTLDASLFPPGMQQLPVPPSPPQQQLYGAYYGQQMQVQPPAPIPELGPAQIGEQPAAGPLDTYSGEQPSAEVQTSMEAPAPVAQQPEVQPPVEAPPQLVQ